MLLENVTLLGEVSESDRSDNWPFINTLPRQLAKEKDGRKSIQKKAKRARTAFTSNQLLMLEEAFKMEQYIGREHRVHLSKLLTLHERQIKIWFQNRRMKEKRNSSDSSDSIKSMKAGSPDTTADFIEKQNSPPAFERYNCEVQNPMSHEDHYVFPNTLKFNEMQNKTLGGFNSLEIAAAYNNWKNTSDQVIMPLGSGSTSFQNYYQEQSAVPTHQEIPKYWSYDQYQQQPLLDQQFAQNCFYDLGHADIGQYINM